MEIALVLLIVAAAVYLFVTERFSASLVGMMVLCGLMLVTIMGPLVPGFRPERWVTAADCTAGFANAATLSVAGMFLLSAGLQSTGAIQALGTFLVRRIRWSWLRVALLLGSASFASAFINNTAAVAVFMPVLAGTCAVSGLAASRVMIPLSYACQIGGVCTLIGTSTNLLVASIAQQRGLPVFGLFDFTPLGLVLVAAAAVYFILLGRWVLPLRKTAGGGGAGYQMPWYATELLVRGDSPLIGRQAAAGMLGEDPRTRVLAVRRQGVLREAEATGPLQEGDVLLAHSGPETLLALCSRWRLHREAEHRFGEKSLKPTDIAIGESMVSPDSNLVGRTLAEIGFAEKYRCIVAGLHRRDVEAGPLRLAHSRLRAGDVLLLVGSQEALDALRPNPDLLMLDRVSEPGLRRKLMPLSIAIFTGAVALAASGLVPLLFALLLGAVLLVATRCLRLEEALSAVDWKVILLLGCMLPLGTAIEKSGAAALLAGAATSLAGSWGPQGVLVVVYLVTAVLTEFMSNNATAVLLSPIAISLAGGLGISPLPLLAAVCFAASTSFCTPVGYQTNAMVQQAGGYRFSDYLRAGLPLNLLFLVVSCYLIPRFWSF